MTSISTDVPASEVLTPTIISRSPRVEAAPLAALELPSMPTDTHFRRDHFPAAPCAREDWRLTLTGSSGVVIETLAFADLERLPAVSLTVVLECAGHRRAEFEPAAKGVPWQIGALSEATWTGARLADVLQGHDLSAVANVVLEGGDRGLAGEGDPEISFARALPRAKALHPATLLAWEMNGEPLPAGHGAPVRAIVPGWYATDSIKWLSSIRLLDRAFDGYFEAVDYRLPNEDGSGTQRMSVVPVNSLLTSHEDGAILRPGRVALRGIAWGGRGVASVELSLDGCPWFAATIERGTGRYGRTFWHAGWDVEPGPHEIRVRAADRDGLVQPDCPRWNARGYGNAAIQRVGVFAEA